jgi:hypothetical protein
MKDKDITEVYIVGHSGPEENVVISIHKTLRMK